jgi:hypothetical protein
LRSREGKAQEQRESMQGERSMHSMHSYSDALPVSFSFPHHTPLLTTHPLLPFFSAVLIPLQVKLAYPHVFCASIALSHPGRPEALRVLVESYDRAHEMDAWGFVGHQVSFQSSHAPFPAPSFATHAVGSR